MNADAATDHRGLRVLDLDECLARLRAAVVGRLAFIHDGDPIVLPVTIGVDGTSVVFRTSWGSKLQAAGDSGPVALEVDDIDPAAGTGWSVLVKGAASVEYDGELAHRWDRLGVPRWLDTGGETFWVRLTAEEISGRELVAPS